MKNNSSNIASPIFGRVIIILVFVSSIISLSCSADYGRFFGDKKSDGSRAILLPQFTDEYLMSEDAYKKRYSAAIDFNADATRIEMMRQRYAVDYYRLYTDNTIKIRNNYYCSTINPHGRGVDSLTGAVETWRKHIALRRGDGFNQKYIGFAKQEKDDYCWVAALQFLSLYQFGEYRTQNAIFDEIKTDIKDKSVDAGNFINIMDFKNRYKTSWWVATSSESMLIVGNAQDCPVLVATKDSDQDVGHIVLAIGSSFSFITCDAANDYNKYCQVPFVSVLMKPSYFVIHKILIFDPRDATVQEKDPNIFFKTIQFMAIVQEPRFWRPYPPMDLTR